MAYVDILYVMAVFVALFVLLASTYFIWNIEFPIMNSSAAGTTAVPVMTNINKTVNGQFDFFFNNFQLLYIIFSIVAVLLTVVLISNPIGLAVWLIINLLGFVLFDSLITFVTSFAGTPIYTTKLDAALDFLQSGVPQLLPLFNMLLAIVLVGKRAFGGSQ